MYVQTCSDIHTYRWLVVVGGRASITWVSMISLSNVHILQLLDGTYCPMERYSSRLYIECKANYSMLRSHYNMHIYAHTCTYMHGGHTYECQFVTIRNSALLHMHTSCHIPCITSTMCDACYRACCALQAVWVAGS